MPVSSQPLHFLPSHPSILLSLSPPLPSPPSPPLPPLTGTDKLVVAVHLAYAFAQKNRRMGVRKAAGMQHCVLLCAPDDATVDATLSELCGQAVCVWVCEWVCDCMHVLMLVLVPVYVCLHAYGWV